jgi:hypothetical protein
VLAAAPLLAAGIALFAWAGPGSNLELPTVSVTTADRALVADGIDVFVGDEGRYLPSIGEAGITVRGTHPLFVGVGPADQVRTYVANPQGDPADQTFWVSTSGGTSATVDWNELRSGRWSAVVMNADGSAGVDATVRATIPAFPVRVAGVVVSLLGIGAGTVGLLLIGAAWGGRRNTTPATPVPAAG